MRNLEEPDGRGLGFGEVRRFLFAYLVVHTLAACSKSTANLDDKKLAENVRQMLEPAGIKTKSIDCPANRPVKAGDKFTCVVVADSGEKFVVNMEQRDGGDVLSTTDGAVIHPPTIVKSGVARFGWAATATATCSKWISKVNEVVTCEVHDGGKTRKLEVKTLDLDGKFDARELDQPETAKPTEPHETGDGSDAHETHE